MERDQDPGLSENMQTLLSQNHGSLQNTDGEIISNPSDCKQAMEAYLPLDETINSEFKIARCEKGKELMEEELVVLEKKKKEEEDKRKEEEEEKKGKEEEEEEKLLTHYLQLYKYIKKGDWENTERAFARDPSTKTGPITSYGGTALSTAVRSGVPIQFIKNLVGLMSKTDLEILGSYKSTALHWAAVVGYSEAAKVLLNKNPSLAKFRTSDDKTPIDLAAMHAHKDTVLLLLPVTRLEDPTVFTGGRGVYLLNDLIIAKFFDIAIYLLKCYPNLAIQKDNVAGFTAFYYLALQPNSFFSGNRLNFLQRLLYKCIHVGKVNVYHREDVENPAADIEYPPLGSRESRTKFKFLQNIHDTKLMHLQALQLAKILCSEILKAKNFRKDNLFVGPIIAAARLGIHELVWEIVKAFPDAIWSTDENGCGIFHLAVLNRKERVYNLSYQMSLERHYLMSYRDNFGNNILHLAGMLGPSDRISGAALHMQRELQWFKEVENTIPRPYYKVQPNIFRQTPREVFTEAHKDLIKKGEEWMKNTATSCSFVAALVITVVFAASFTFPGGNNSDGYPIFLNHLSFLIFSASNALALLSSSTSVLMFLGILTSRYLEEDFLRALPMRLCIGLATLFLSIAFMLAAFSSALHIVLVHRLSWVAAPIVVMACIPLTLFVFLQFPLLMEMISSTFGPSIFCKQDNEIFF